MSHTSISLQLAVAELGTTEAFYRGLLGVPVRRAVTARGGQEYLVMRHEGWEVIFVDEQAVMRTHPMLNEAINTFPKGVGLTIHLRVEGIEDIYDSLIEEDIQILYPLEEKPYGMKEFWCLDPDGYLVVLEESTRL
ncbi:VOC family protein [Geobacter sp. DSM 9736]|uniref:VOC family protein n=1 Tax=Geobacter sp. DSM 9736 TaxID=1277350 RepID=UPI000B50E8F5|nr:VOC family protein [Geobacter sp. DSM 9736]SNB44738.1 Glyoxalase/Bleomycin resistance protein/Dioxygenase superfamily protein [Geobacter sp. DSM 9736]